MSNKVLEDCYIVSNIKEVVLKVEIERKSMERAMGTVASVEEPATEKKEEKKDDGKKEEGCYIVSNMKEMVLKVEMEGKNMEKALGTVASVEGLEFFSVDMKEKKITVIGDLDRVSLIIKLEKLGTIKLLSASPSKEEKKDEKKPATEKKDEKKGTTEKKGKK